jgi:hypothetical protein
LGNWLCIPADVSRLNEQIELTGWGWAILGIDCDHRNHAKIDASALRVGESMASHENDQAESVAFLSDASSYGVAGPVEVHQTHGSFVFLARDHAYKLKQAVKFPYMDYSTPARRRAMCERELVVNKRMAPMLYEAVRSVVNDEGKWRFGLVEDEKEV